MYNNLDLTKVLFLDIETVSEHATYDHLDETFQGLWKLKTRQVLRQYDEPITEEQAVAAYPEKAGIYAEFGKIICISVGIVTRIKGQLGIRLKSFASDDEAELLRDFAKMVNQYYNNPNQHFFCGHNLREFDVPYMCRRMLINQIELPRTMDISGKKPWETKHLLDTLEMWKFGDYKSYTSLELLAALFNIPTPKDDIDGSMIGDIYYHDQNLERIKEYCQKDVITLASIFLRMNNKPSLKKEEVIIV